MHTIRLKAALSCILLLVLAGCGGSADTAPQTFIPSESQVPPHVGHRKSASQMLALEHCNKNADGSYSDSLTGQPCGITWTPPSPSRTTSLTSTDSCDLDYAYCGSPDDPPWYAGGCDNGYFLSYCGVCPEDYSFTGAELAKLGCLDVIPLGFASNGGSSYHVPYGAVTSVTVGISTAGSSGPAIPTAGHLYIQFWYGGIPIGFPIQAGNDNGLLGPARFLQYPITQPQYWLNYNAETLAANLTRNRDTYQHRYPNWPAYSATSMNSNSWADGLLLSAGEPQSTIDAAVQYLEGQSGLTPYAYTNGSQIKGDF